MKEEENDDQNQKNIKNPFVFNDFDEDEIEEVEQINDIEEEISEQEDVLKKLKETFNDEQIKDSSLRKLVRFTTGIKDLTSEELDSLRNDEDELSRLMRVFFAKSKFFKYNPKKKFDKTYRQKRKAKNKLAKRQRAINHKKEKVC